MPSSTDKTEFEFLVPGKPESLSAVRWIITRLAQQTGLPEEEINKIEVAVDEACANVIEHAYGPLPEKPPIYLKMMRENGCLIIDIIDEGTGFDFDHYRPPTFPDHYQEGNQRGAGLYLMYRCMDEVSYETMPNQRNRMRLVKQMTAGGPPPTPGNERIEKAY